MTPPSSYEAVPYISQPFSFTHPVRMQTLGTLFGLPAPDAGRCRVLELGCGSGVNLCAMASSLPESRFVGVDLSESRIAEGRAVIAELGLSNVELVHADIAALGGELGSFEYIVCHGLFSWVKPEIQSKILQICREQLRPDGVAYVSYNTLPGWHPRRMIREMLLYHAEQFRDSDMFLEQARGMVTLLNKALRNNDAPLAAFLKNSLKQIQDYPDWFLRHDVLEDVNEPLYFHQFAARAEAAGLQYLGDSELPKMVDVGFPDDVRQALRAIALDVVRFEQYLDFLWNRIFRRSLLCRSEAALSRELAPMRLQSCFLGSSLKAVPPAAGTVIRRFETPAGAFLETNDPFAVHVLNQLGAAWPQAVSFQELFANAEQSMKGTFSFTPETRRTEMDHLGHTLWNLAIRDLVEIQTRPWTFVREVSERPLASSFARRQARSATEVTNARHEVLSLEPAAAAVLALLDGTMTKDKVLSALRSSRSPEMTGGELDEIFAALAGQAFLIG